MNRLAVVVKLSEHEEYLYRTRAGNWSDSPVEAEILLIDRAMEIVAGLSGAVGLLSWSVDAQPPFLELSSDFPLVPLTEVAVRLGVPLPNLYSRLRGRGCPYIYRNRQIFVREEDVDPFIRPKKLSLI